MAQGWDNTDPYTTYVWDSCGVILNLCLHNTYKCVCVRVCVCASVCIILCVLYTCANVRLSVCLCVFKYCMGEQKKMCLYVRACMCGCLRVRACMCGCFVSVRVCL
jgi:hypothetical protein